MAKQIGTRRLAYRVLGPSVTKDAACRFVFQCIRPRSRLQTDGAGIYRGVQRRWPVTHRRDIHARFEFGLTSEIEGVFGNLRTFLRRMYHHTTPKYLPDLVGEFAARFTHAEWFDSPHACLRISLPAVPLA